MPSTLNNIKSQTCPSPRRARRVNVRHITSLYLYLFLLLFPATQISAQLQFDTLYATEYVKEKYAEAQKEKDTLQIGMAAFILSGHLEWHHGTNSEIIDLLTLSLDCFSVLKDSAAMYRVRHHLAEYYIDMGLYDEAIDLNLISEKYAQGKKDTMLLAHINSNLARLYNLKNMDSISEEYYRKSQMYNRVAKDTLLDIIYLIVKIERLHKEEKYDSAHYFSRKSLALAQAIDNRKFTAINLINVGVFSQHLGQIDTAIYYLKKGGEMDRPIGYSSLRRWSYEQLVNCFEKKGDYKQAFIYSQKYAVLSDSILDKDRNAAMNKVVMQYEAKEKAAAIATLEKENKIIEEKNRQKNFMLAGLSILFSILLVAIVFTARFYREKIKGRQIISEQEKALNQNKLDALEKEMRLASVKAVLEGQENERVRVARDLHDSLGGLLSTIKLQLKNKGSENPREELGILLDKATDEVRGIAQNLQPSALQQLGLVAAVNDLVNIYAPKKEGTKINFQHYNVPANIAPNIALHFYRIIQEALNNALKHANASEVMIQINGEKKGISILVEDDGKGFDPAEKTAGRGLGNIRQRAEFIHADLSIESGENGTTVFMFFPFS